MHLLDFERRQPLILASLRNVFGRYLKADYKAVKSVFNATGLGLHLVIMNEFKEVLWVGFVETEGLSHLKLILQGIRQIDHWLKDFGNKQIAAQVATRVCPLCKGEYRAGNHTQLKPHSTSWYCATVMGKSKSIEQWKEEQAQEQQLKRPRKRYNQEAFSLKNIL
jgi:hypothetical protein